MWYFMKESGLFILVALVGLFCGVYLGLGVSKEHYDRKLSECENAKRNDEIVISKTALDILKTYQELYYKTKGTFVYDTIVKTKTVIKIDTVYIAKESFKSDIPSTILFKKE